VANKFLLESALRLRNGPEFQEFRAWLDSEQQQALKVLTGNQEHGKMLAAQGAYAQIQRIKDLLEDAPKLLDKQRPGVGRDFM
jgi:hypothetical protein